MDSFLSLSYPTYKWFISQLAIAAFLNTFLFEILWHMLVFLFSYTSPFLPTLFYRFHLLHSTSELSPGSSDFSVSTLPQRSQSSNRIKVIIGTCHPQAQNSSLIVYYTYYKIQMLYVTCKMQMLWGLPIPPSSSPLCPLLLHCLVTFFGTHHSC